MIKYIFNKLFKRENKEVNNFVESKTENDFSVEYEITNKEKLFLINCIQTHMKLKRDDVYKDISDDCSFEEFSKKAKEKWEKVLSVIFSEVVMKDKEIRVHQQISSEVFNMYYGEMMNEIRNNVYNMCKHKFNLIQMIRFSNDLKSLYMVLTKKKRKEIKFLHFIGKYGEDMIMNELRMVVNKIVKEKATLEMPLGRFK